jgi:hypothetical protein
MKEKREAERDNGKEKEGKKIMLEKKENKEEANTFRLSTIV